MEPTVREWLNKRGITDEVIASSELASENGQILIPVYDERGSFLFNKIRRSPQSTEGPKYTYTAGSSSSLYNVHTIQHATNQNIFICEGELDALVLNSLGQLAVTSTGGSGTFLKEWAEYFEGKENVFIVFDKDDAGYKGAMKVQGLLPHAKMVFLPDTMEGNDITDYFQQYTFADFVKLGATQFPIPREPSGELDKKTLKATVAEFKHASDTLLQIKRDLVADRKSVRPILIMLEYTRTRYESYSEMLKRFDKKQQYDGSSDDVVAAKSVPIPQYVSFNYDGFSKCIWHDEKSGSMKYNKPESKYPNTVKCFGCGAMGDTIDVVMQLKKVDFKDAVKIILNK
jgi:DNA primase